MFTVDYDETTGIVRCTTGGFLSVADVQQYSWAVRDAADRSKREFGSIAMLVISPEPKVQSAEVIEEVAKHRKPSMGPNDRTAMVLPSALVRLQAARTFTSESEKVFTSESEARAWLMAIRPAGKTATRARI